MTNTEDEFDPEFDQAQQARDKSNEEARHDMQLQTLERRQQAYRRLFKGKAEPSDIERVKEDLQTFCRGDTSAFHMNDRIHCLLTGRQEVYARIMDHLRLDLDALVLKYTATPQKEEQS
jgi:hypothetical protein